MVRTDGRPDEMLYLVRTAAAQVSRDRKKEHVSELEDRVRELESQLLAFQRSGAPSMSSSTSSASPIPPPSIDLPALSRPIRTPSPSPSSFSSASTISPLQAASLSQARIAVLEEENEGLKKRLEEGEREKAELKGRLEGVEKRFEWMERVLNGVVNLTSGPAAPTSTPAPAPAVASTDAVDWTHLLSTFNNQPQQPSAYSTTADRGGVVGSGSNGINERLVAREESLQRTLTMLLRLRSALPSPSPSRPRSQREKKLAVRARSTSRVSTLTLGPLACPPRLLPQRRAWTGRGHQGCGKIRLFVRRQTRS